jgi:hypothetical protein
MHGIDEFLDQVTVLPPGQWDPQIRIEPPEKVPSQVTKSTNVYSHIITLSRSLNLEIYQPLVNLLILYIYIYILVCIILLHSRGKKWVNK